MVLQNLSESTVNLWVSVNSYAERFNTLVDIEEADNDCLDVKLRINDELSFFKTYGLGIKDEDSLQDVLRRYTDYIAELEDYLNKKAFQVKDGFTLVEGGTHDFPALVWSLTDEEVFFKDEGGKMIPLDDEVGIDCFKDKKGNFYLRQGRFTIAQWKVWMHDTFNCFF